MENTKKIIKKMTEKIFKEELLIDLSKIRYDHLEPSDGVIKLVVEYLYPNLMNNIPKILRHPKIWDSIKTDGDVLQLIDHKDFTENTINTNRELSPITQRDMNAPSLLQQNPLVYENLTKKAFELEKKENCINNFFESMANCIIAVVESISKCCISCLIKLDRFLSASPEKVLIETEERDDDEVLKERKKSPD